MLGLPAKPIVDLAVGLSTGHELAAVTRRLEAAGWIYRGNAADSGGHVFVLEDRAWHRVAHLHVVEHGGAQWLSYLRLRDLLRQDPEARGRYEAVKLRLADECGDDRKAYTEGKSAVIMALLLGIGFHETAMVPKPNGRFFWHMGWQTVPEVPEMLIRDNEAAYLRFVIENVAYDPTAITPDALAHYVEAIRRPGAPCAPASPSTSSTGPTPPKPTCRTKLDIPTLAYGGDALLRDIPRSSMEQLANNVEGGVVERCGHFIPEEQPAWLADTLTNFFTAALASAPPTSDSKPARA